MSESPAKQDSIPIPLDGKKTFNSNMPDPESAKSPLMSPTKKNSLVPSPNDSILKRLPTMAESKNLDKTKDMTKEHTIVAEKKEGNSLSNAWKKLTEYYTLDLFEKGGYSLISDGNTLQKKTYEKAKKNYQFARNQYSIFSEDKDNFNENTFDWRTVIRTDEASIQERIAFFKPFQLMREVNYPIEYILFDNHIKLFLDIKIVYNYLSNVYDDVASSAYPKILAYYTNLINFFLIYHLASDAKFLDKLDSDKLMLLNPMQRMKIRKFNRAYLKIKYEADDKINIFNFIKILLLDYFPRIGKHLLKIKFCKQLTQIFDVIRFSLELGLLDIVDARELLIMVKTKCYFLDKIEDFFIEQMGTEYKLFDDVGEPDDMMKAQIDYEELQDALIYIRHEVCKICMQVFTFAYDHEFSKHITEGTKSKMIIHDPKKGAQSLNEQECYIKFSCNTDQNYPYQIEAEYFDSMIVGFNYLGSYKRLYGKSQNCCSFQKLIDELSMLSIDITYNPFFISCSLLTTGSFWNYEGPIGVSMKIFDPEAKVEKKTNLTKKGPIEHKGVEGGPDGEQATVFAIREEMERIITDSMNKVYTINYENLATKEDFIADMTQVIDDLTRMLKKHELNPTKSDKLRYEMTVFRIPLTVLVMLDMITPAANFDKEMAKNSTRKEMIYKLLEILKKATVKNYFAQNQIIRNQGLFYVKRLLNKIEDQMIVVLNFIFMDKSYLLALDNDFCDILIEKYRAYMLRHIRWSKDISKKTFVLKNFLSLYSYTNLQISIMNHEFWKGTKQSTKQEACMYRTDVDLHKSRGLSGFNIRIQQLFEYQWAKDQLIEHDENEEPDFYHVRNALQIDEFEMANENEDVVLGEQEEKLSQRSMTLKIVAAESNKVITVPAQSKDPSVYSVKDNESQRTRGPTAIPLKGEVKTVVEPEEPQQKSGKHLTAQDATEKAKAEKKKEVPASTRNLPKIHISTGVEKMREAIKNDEYLICKQFKFMINKYLLINKIGQTAYVKNFLSEDIYMTTNMLELLRVGIEPADNEQGSMQFELGVAIMKLINQSIDNLVIESFCTLLNETSHILKKLLDKKNIFFDYLFDFKEGVKLKTEMLKLVGVVDPLAPNYIINHRLTKFKAKDTVRGMNLYEDYSTYNLIHDFPEYQRKELSFIDREYGQAEIGKTLSNFNENEKRWRKDYLFNGLLKLIYIYSQYMWLYYDNTDDQEMYAAYERLNVIYSSLHLATSKINRILTNVLKDCSNIQTEMFNKEFLDFLTITYDNAKILMLEYIDKVSIPPTEKLNPQLFLLRQKAYILSTRIYYLYEQVGYDKILDRYYCPNGTREKTQSYTNINKDLDINASRCVAVYKYEVDDYGKFNVFAPKKKDEIPKNYDKVGGHPRVMVMHNRVTTVAQDLVSYIKEDFRSNIINVPKKKNARSVDNKWFRMFSDTNTQFVPIQTFNYVFERFLDPLYKENYNFNKAFQDLLKRPHLLSYIIFLDNSIQHDPNTRDKLYKYFLQEIEKEKLHLIFHWIYYILFNFYQFVLNKPFQDSEWSMYNSKYIVLSGFLISLCQNNHLKFKSLMSDVFPKYDNEPGYFNPTPESNSIPMLFYSLYFEEFFKSSCQDSNMQDELIESDYPSRLLTVSRIIEVCTEFVTGPSVKNQNIINDMHLVPLINITMRNMKDINSVYYRLQKQILQFIISLLQGRNEKSILIIEQLIDPNAFLDSLFSHFKKLYLYIIINFAHEKEVKCEAIRANILAEFYDKILDMEKNAKQALVKELDFEEREKKFSEHKVLWTRPPDVKIIEEEVVIILTPQEKLKKEKYALAMGGPRWIKPPPKCDPPPVAKALQGIKEGVIDDLLERCLTKNLKLRYLEFLWERSKTFIEHPFYKLCFLYYGILLAPGDKGAKFNYCLEAQSKRTLKALGAGCNYHHMYAKEKSKDFIPSYTIRIYMDLKKVEIEVVDQTKLHHLLIFPRHPKSKFIEQHTKDKFEKKSPTGECSTKMTYLLNNVKIFSLETDTNYFWKIRLPPVHMIIQYSFMRKAEIFLFMISALTNVLIFTSFKRDEILLTFRPDTDFMAMVIDITTFLEVGVSMVLLIFWFFLRWPESIKVRKLRRVEGLDEIEAEKAMKVRSWDDFKIDYLDSFLEKSVPQSLLAHFGCSLQAFITINVFYGTKMFTIFNISETAKFLLKTVLGRIQTIIMAFMVSCMVTWNFAILLARFYANEFRDAAFQGRDTCQTLMECFLNVLDLGQRNGGGIADSLMFINYDDPKFFGRYFFDLMFFFMVNVICINVIFSIMIDVLGQFRDDNNAKKKDQKNQCYVCGQNRASFEQKGLNFDNHTNEEHDKFNYADYIIYLGTVIRSELDGLELYIITCYENGRIAWIPQGKSKYLERNSNAGPGGNKVEELEKKLSDLSEKVDSVQDYHKKFKGMEKWIGQLIENSNAFQSHGRPTPHAIERAPVPVITLGMETNSAAEGKNPRKESNMDMDENLLKSANKGALINDEDPTNENPHDKSNSKDIIKNIPV